MNSLNPALLRAALGDEHPRVVAHSVRLCESRFAADPDLGPAVLKLTTKPELVLPLAGTLGGWDDPRAGTGLGAHPEGARRQSVHPVSRVQFVDPEEPAGRHRGRPR